MDFPKEKKKKDLPGQNDEENEDSSDQDIPVTNRKTVYVFSACSLILPTDPGSSGPLAKVSWLRVVIDEAQNIRNKSVYFDGEFQQTSSNPETNFRSTRISTCVAKLDARYRWCLTGTPITNTL